MTPAPNSRMEAFHSCGPWKSKHSFQNGYPNRVFLCPSNLDPGQPRDRFPALHGKETAVLKFDFVAGYRHLHEKKIDRSKFLGFRLVGSKAAGGPTNVRTDI